MASSIHLSLRNVTLQNCLKLQTSNKSLITLQYLTCRLEQIVTHSFCCVTGDTSDRDLLGAHWPRQINRVSTKWLDFTQLGQLCCGNISAKESRVRAAATYIKQLEDECGRPLISSRRKTGFACFLVPLNSIVNISHQLINNGCKYILAYRLSQDHLGIPPWENQTSWWMEQQPQHSAIQVRSGEPAYEKWGSCIEKRQLCESLNCASA